MRQSKPELHPRGLPKAVAEVCAHLEERGLRTFSHGEGLLDDLRAASGADIPAAAAHDRAEECEPDELGAAPRPLRPTRSLLCVARPDQLLRALPRAVVTGERAERLTQASADGPIDLVPTEAFPGRPSADRRSPEAALLAFGLGPLGFAFRPADESWCDPADQLEAFRQGRLEPVASVPNVFEAAPRRYWIAARLLAEYELEPSAGLIAAAREAFTSVAERLPQAQPARRELARVLAAERPGPALAFLRESGVSGYLFPGTTAVQEERIALLPNVPAIRWAAWLRGSATAAALARLRMPHALARQIERAQTSHPIERSVEAGRDHGLRRLLQRHAPPEISALLAWRRIELEASPNRSEAQEGLARLDRLEKRIEEARAAAERTGLVRTLALDGEAVMRLLDAGPGPHVGRALAHLAQVIAEHPEANEPDTLEAELRRWAAAHTNLLD